MRRHRFVGEFDFNENLFLIKDLSICHQIKDVLRLKKGDLVELGNANGQWVLAKITKLSVDDLMVKIESRFKINNEKRKVILYCAIIKKQNFELAIQKAVEAGVAEIVPTITTRTVKFGLYKERLNKIIKEASEQSMRNTVPILSDAVDFKFAIEKAKENDVNWFFDLSGDINWKDAVCKINSDKDLTIGVFVGPEGGFSKEEVDLAKNNNFKLINLGQGVLRAESAALISVFLAGN